MRAFQNTYPCSSDSELCRGEDINANVTIDYEKLGVNGIIHTSISRTLRCFTAVGCGRLVTAAAGDARMSLAKH
jgi:hypothetical protein